MACTPRTANMSIDSSSNSLPQSESCDMLDTATVRTHVTALSSKLDECFCHDDLEKHLSYLPDPDLNHSAETSMVSQAPQQEEVTPDPDLVEFDGPEDVGNPRNWSSTRRTLIAGVLGFMALIATFSSSVFAAAIDPVAEELKVNRVVSTLGVSLFLAGFVFGPIVFGPASEVFGRRPPLLIGFTLFAFSQIPVAISNGIGMILLARFVGGFTAAAPLVTFGGVLVDLFEPVERAYAVCAFASAVFSGPAFGAIVGSYIVESNLGWRWTQWLTLILSIGIGLLGLVLIPETSAPRILQNRARDLRLETKNWALHAKADEVRVDSRTIMSVYLVRPFVMFVQEPILALLTAYMSVLYGIIYLLLEAFPVAFHDVRQWSLGASSLPFCAFIIGVAIGAALMAYSAATNYRSAFIKHGRVVPEERLPVMIAGAVVLPLSLFWFGWTSDPSLSCVPQLMAITLMGFGSLTTFWQGMSYIIDVYGFYTNSAIAINTFVRSLVGASFPLFASHMFRQLGVGLASTVLAIILIVFLPAPILFYTHGARIRSRSRFRPSG